MNNERITCTSRLTRWTGANGGNWFILNIDGEAAETLSATALMRRLELGKARGFGSLRVTAQIGDTDWQTSAFPRKDGGWLMLVKKSVRHAEGLDEDDTIELNLVV